MILTATVTGKKRKRRSYDPEVLKQGVTLCDDGKYRWIYAMNMWKNHFSMEKKQRKRRNKIMMIDPEQYVEQFENASYQEILKVKNELVSDITKFEHDYDREDPDWNICPKPDVRYQWNLEALGLIAPLLSKAFNSEYEWGDRKRENL